MGKNFTWRRFCRIAIDEKMPDPSTLIYARKRYGEDIEKELNEALVQKLEEKHILKHRKMRTDTAVTESNIHHPTGAGLLQDGVRIITRLVKKVKEVACHAVQGFENRNADIKEKILSMAKVLRRRTRESWEEVDKITQSVIEITERVVSQATVVLEKRQDKGRQNIKQRKETLEKAVELTTKLVNQAKQVVTGTRIIPDRIVSFFDPEARPIKKGKLSKKTEFGYKVRIDETESGFVTGYEVYEGNPSDDGMLLDAVKDHKKQFGKVPRAVAADRGFFGKQNDIDLEKEGVLRRSLPRKGKKGKKRSEYEKELWFQDLQRFRAAGEAKISLLKRKYGLDRSRYRGFANTKSWVGFGILTHNLVRAAKILKEGAN